jgi:hypothetical protein
MFNNVHFSLHPLRYQPQLKMPIKINRLTKTYLMILTVTKRTPENNRPHQTKSLRNPKQSTGRSMMIPIKVRCKSDVSEARYFRPQLTSMDFIWMNRHRNHCNAMNSMPKWRAMRAYRHQRRQPVSHIRMIYRCHRMHPFLPHRASKCKRACYLTVVMQTPLLVFYQLRMNGGKREISIHSHSKQRCTRYKRP